MASYVPSRAYGPWLRYSDCDYSQNLWRGSILVVSLSQQPPQLWCSHAGNQIPSQPQCLDEFQSFRFWRWQIDLRLLQNSSIVEYGVSTEWIQGQTFQKTFRFHLPAIHEPWHWGFHSCNGFSSDVEASWLPAATTLWQDVLKVHQNNPLHCMVGGGDQLYQDAFFKEPAMVQWLKQDRKVRESASVTQDMDAQIHHFMFHHYCNWFSKDHMSEAFASIPQVMTWDDHDLMDGWGSYPEQLQNCPVFQFAYRVGRRFYLLFQQHTTLELAHTQGGLFGIGETFSMIRMLGQNVALIAPDVRAERTRKTIISPANWENIFNRINSLPATVKHLVVLTTIPVVYPKIPLSEKAMGLLSNLGREHAVDTILAKTGLWKAVQGKVVSHFDEPELLDDLLDHWTSDFHIKERDMLIQRLQGISSLRNMRMTFISGDVHVGGLGRLYSYPKVDLRKDHRFMPQIVSSAIMNAPPPAGVVSVLHTCSNAHNSGDKSTKEKMVRLFAKDYPKTDKLVARRNWTDIREIGLGTQPPQIVPNPKVNQVSLQGGDLLAVLRVEKDHKLLANSPIQEYSIIIPVLDTGRPSAAPIVNASQQTYTAASYQTPNIQTPNIQSSGSYGQPPTYGVQQPQIQNTNYGQYTPQIQPVYGQAQPPNPPASGQYQPNYSQYQGAPPSNPAQGSSQFNYSQPSQGYQNSQTPQGYQIQNPTEQGYSSHNAQGYQAPNPGYSGQYNSGYNGNLNQQYSGPPSQGYGGQTQTQGYDTHPNYTRTESYGNSQTEPYNQSQQGTNQSNLYPSVYQGQQQGYNSGAQNPNQLASQFNNMSMGNQPSQQGTGYHNQGTNY